MSGRKVGTTRGRVQRGHNVQNVFQRYHRGDDSTQPREGPVSREEAAQKIRVAVDAVREERRNGQDIKALMRILQDAREAFLRQDFEDAASRAETVLVLCTGIDPFRLESPDPVQDPGRAPARAPRPVDPRTGVAHPGQESRPPSRRKVGLAIGAAIVASVVIVAVLVGAFPFLKASQKQPSYLAKLGVNHAEWRYESPTLSTHTPRGQYYLWLNVSVNNSGTHSLGVEGFGFKLRWKGETAGVPGSYAWSSFDLAPGRSTNVTIAFPSAGLKTSDLLDFQYSPSGTSHVQASVPAPSAPATEVTFGTSSAQWKNNDTYGRPPIAGDRFLWLAFEMRNAWDKSAVIFVSYFKAEGLSGSIYTALQQRGADEIAPGGRGNVTLVFEVPTTWMPKVLHYDMTIGPWADMAIATPSGP
jgi:hypothetical protein